MRIKLGFFLIVFGFLSACATTSKRSSDSREYMIRLRGVEGRKELYSVYSRSDTVYRDMGKPERQKKEVVDFILRTETKDSDDVRGIIKMVQTTISKNGKVDLNTLGFPELNQTIDMTFDARGNVLKAGNFPKDSLFYVSPISIPDEDVKIGDSWTMTQEWLSKESKIPLRIDLVTILKNVFPCAKNDTCVDLEVSGNVEVLSLDQGSSQFDSDVRGRIIFALNRGSILWSITVSEEKLSTEKAMVGSRSCVISRLTEPVDEQWAGRKEKTCDPTKSFSQLLGY